MVKTLKDIRNHSRKLGKVFQNSLSYLKSLPHFIAMLRSILEPSRLVRNLPPVFQVDDCFWARENQRSKNEKTIFFQDKFYSLKAHAHYFTVFVYLAT